MLNELKTKRAISLIEVLIASTVLSLVALSVIDLSTNLVIAETTFNNDVVTKQERVSVMDKITSSIREAVYIYPDYSSIELPGGSNVINVSTSHDSLAALVPKFNSDGTVAAPSEGITSFTGLVYSFVPSNQWDGSDNTDDFVLVQTVAEFDLAVDGNDSLLITETLPSDWTSGESYLLAEDLKPIVTTNMGYEGFWVNDDRNLVEFALIPKADGLYFPSSYGSGEELDDTAYISSISIRNWREPIN